MRKCEVAKMRNKKRFFNNLLTYGIVIIAYCLAQAAMSGNYEGFSMNRLLTKQMVPVCAYVVLAVSLNLVVGISGELSLGHAGFMSVGAFSGIISATWIERMSRFVDETGAYAELVKAEETWHHLFLEVANKGGVTYIQWNDTTVLVLAMIVGGIMAGIAGFVIGIPALRLRGDYLAIVLLAFGEIIRNVMNCVYVSIKDTALSFSLELSGSAPALEAGAENILSGTQGTVSNVLSKANKAIPERFMIGFALVLFTLIVVLNLINSRSGRAIMAIRDNRIAAESVGLNVMKYKMMAFVTGAALAGMAGALYGLNMGSIKSDMFDYNMSIEILVMVVLGGIGSIRGSVIAAVALTLLPEQLRFLKDYRMLVYAIVLILVMLATNSSILKNLWSWLNRIEPIGKIVERVANGVLNACAWVLGGLAGTLKQMVGWCEKKQRALEDKASGATKIDGKAGDEQ